MFRVPCSVFRVPCLALGVSRFVIRIAYFVFHSIWGGSSVFRIPYFALFGGRQGLAYFSCFVFRICGRRVVLGSRLKALGSGRVGRPGLISLRRSPQLNCSPSQFSAREAFSLRLSVATVGKLRQTAMERWQEMLVVNKMGSLSL